MSHKEAIDWLRERGIKREDDGGEFTYEDDIPEKPERELVDAIGRVRCERFLFLLLFLIADLVLAGHVAQFSARHQGVLHESSCRRA